MTKATALRAQGLARFTCAKKKRALKNTKSRLRRSRLGEFIAYGGIKGRGGRERKDESEGGREGGREVEGEGGGGRDSNREGEGFGVQ